MVDYWLAESLEQTAGATFDNEQTSPFALTPERIDTLRQSFLGHQARHLADPFEALWWHGYTTLCTVDGSVAALGAALDAVTPEKLFAHSQLLFRDSHRSVLCVGRDAETLFDEV